MLRGFIARGADFSARLSLRGILLVVRNFLRGLLVGRWPRWRRPLEKNNSGRCAAAARQGRAAAAYPCSTVHHHSFLPPAPKPPTLLHRPSPQLSASVQALLFWALCFAGIGPLLVTLSSLVLRIVFCWSLAIAGGRAFRRNLIIDIIDSDKSNKGSSCCHCVLLAFSHFWW